MWFADLKAILWGRVGTGRRVCLRNICDERESSSLSAPTMKVRSNPKNCGEVGDSFST